MTQVTAHSAHLAKRTGGHSYLQVFLDESRTEMHIQLNERRIPDRIEAVDLASLDDEDVASPAFEGLAVDCPHTAPFADELDFVIWMTVRARAGARSPSYAGTIWGTGPK